MMADFRAEKGAGEPRYICMYPRGRPACKGHLSDIIILKGRAPLAVPRMFSTNHFQFNWSQNIEFYVVTFYHDC